MGHKPGIQSPFVRALLKQVTCVQEFSGPTCRLYRDISCTAYYSEEEGLLPSEEGRIELAAIDLQRMSACAAIDQICSAVISDVEDMRQTHEDEIVYKKWDDGTCVARMPEPEDAKGIFHRLSGVSVGYVLVFPDRSEAGILDPSLLPGFMFSDDDLRHFVYSALRPEDFKRFQQNLPGATPSGY